MFRPGQGDTHAGAHADQASKHVERLFHGSQDAGSNRLEIVEVHDVLDQDGKFVVGETGG